MTEPEEFCKKGVLANFAKIHRKTPVSEPLAQTFSCEFCETFKNTFFHRAALVAAYGMRVFIIAQENSNFPLPYQKIQR